MTPYIYWFVLAFGLLALEMATGTFYMLMLAIAVAIGGVAALLGTSLPIQITFTALAGIIGIVILRRMKSIHPIDAASQSLDTGQPVQLVTWREDGSARVYYRGAEWDAEPESADMPREGALYIKDIHGSKLVLTQHKPQ
ncbi:MAG TPA: NfeD family protein [Gallionella sp.]|jgi:membrane protein implicated in regulation of membrane protease activity|nr:NfeD family protein [Gallionella sp.]